MTTEYAPQALHDLYDRIRLGSKELSGIVGNDAHTYGYHRGRNFVGPADYSVVLRADKGGDGNAACALDVRLNPADMQLATNRLMAACRNGDPRVTTLREFFGTQNGTRVTGWDRHDPSVPDDTTTTSDPSHLWHLHLSIYRGRVADTAAVLQLADVINGAPLPAVPRLHRQWPSYMPQTHYFGLETGPNDSHGGHYATERPDVMAIQARVTALGWKIPVDGHYGPTTKAAVTAWQHARVPGTSRFGEVWSDDWAHLFTY